MVSRAVSAASSGRQSTVKQPLARFKGYNSNGQIVATVDSGSDITALGAGTGGLSPGDPVLIVGQPGTGTLVKPHTPSIYGVRVASDCTCYPLLIGDGAPQNFLFGVSDTDDYQPPKNGWRFWDRRSNRRYTYFDEWIPESYLFNPVAADRADRDLLVESTAAGACLKLKFVDDMGAEVGYDYIPNC